MPEGPRQLASDQSKGKPQEGSAVCCAAGLGGLAAAAARCAARQQRVDGWGGAAVPAGAPPPVHVGRRRAAAAALLPSWTPAVYLAGVLATRVDRRVTVVGSTVAGVLAAAALHRCGESRDAHITSAAASHGGPARAGHQRCRPASAIRTLLLPVCCCCCQCCSAQRAAPLGRRQHMRVLGAAHAPRTGGAAWRPWA